jgi:ribonucleoside-triphosphate reductase (formate)
MKVQTSWHTPARSYFPGMGEAVADRTINRKLVNGKTEQWSDVALRVATGNSLLQMDQFEREFHPLHRHLRQASVLMSGRHLQHGDDTQPTRNQEVYTNCSTSAVSFLLFYLLLNGSGVGRSYDDAMMVVDWREMPTVVPVIDPFHKDVGTGEITAISERDARHFYANRKVTYFRVPDSREGWAQAIEVLETMTFERRKGEVLLLDFSDVRPRGAPIGGMQNRPASGPGPLMQAITKIGDLCHAWMEPWRATMYADHFLAECVLVGGARRAARMATKTWRDKTVLDFIKVKQGGFLWSSNNSVTVDQTFWEYVREDYSDSFAPIPDEVAHAKAVFKAVTWHSYHDKTGEPGFINADKLAANMEGHEVLLDGDIAHSERFQLRAESMPLMQALARQWAGSEYKMITNPCGEITLSMLGGYCVIADVVPFHAARANPVDGPWNVEQWDNDAEEAFRVTTRALMRVNLMDCLYKKEVARTNRIGVGITGLHEYAWARFGFGWRDLIDETKSLQFWKTLSRFKMAVLDESVNYAAELGVAVPHTNTTMKPAGTTSKLFGLTEGAHLPSMREYLRWVQFRFDDPLIDEYEKKGYPVRKLKTYSGTVIVGFPTQPMICSLGMGDKLVTAAEATPEEQYEFLRLMEKWWIRGVDEDGEPLPESGNQVSYTLKYLPDQVSYDEFCRTLIEGQSSIRCCSVMPQIDTTAYEYQPEEPVSSERYQEIVAQITRAAEEIGREHVDCVGGACPIDFRDDD